MQATRQEILDYLRRRGQATVRDLGAHLGLTATGIRQHLTVLERDGMIEAHEELGSAPREAVTRALRQFGDPRALGRRWARESRRGGAS